MLDFNINSGASKYYTTDKKGTSWEVVNNKKTNNRVFLPCLCQLVIDKLVFIPENKLN